MLAVKRERLYLEFNEQGTNVWGNSRVTGRSATPWRGSVAGVFVVSFPSYPVHHLKDDTCSPFRSLSRSLGGGHDL